MFSGQGVQYANMAVDFYKTEPLFASWVDQCVGYLPSTMKQIFYSVLKRARIHIMGLKGTMMPKYMQVILFIIEFSLAKYMMELGIVPSAMIGHSLGEYVAACLAEVMDLRRGVRTPDARRSCFARGPQQALDQVFSARRVRHDVCARSHATGLS